MNRLKGFSHLIYFLAIALISINFTNCASTETYREEPLQGEAAILDWSGWGSGEVLEIDGNATKSQYRAELNPGKHNIRYGGKIGTSFLLNPRMSDSYDYSASIDMRAGHTYKVIHERTYGYGSYKDYFWIEDATTGEIMAGNLPEYQREKKERSEEAVLERQTRDHFEALTVSAECGDAKAQYDLGLYYLAGIPPVARPDIVMAFLWYGLAASNGYHDAATIKERIHKDLSKEHTLAAERLINESKKTDCRINESTQQPVSNFYGHNL
ncbi:MAG: hypothetical protein P8185_12505 [Deltaproteobacteria bacterium]